jgi:hypothetical protein
MSDADKKKLLRNTKEILVNMILQLQQQVSVPPKEDEKVQELTHKYKRLRIKYDKLKLENQKLKEEKKEEPIQVRIQQLHEELKTYSEEEQSALLFPYFKVIVDIPTETIIQAAEPVEIPLDVTEIQVIEDEKYEDEGLDLENRVRTISSASDTQAQPIKIIDPNDIVNILNQIEVKEDEKQFKQIPFIRRNVQKCLGLI